MTRVFWRARRTLPTTSRRTKRRGSTARRGRPSFWIVNTRFSCLCSLHPHYSFAPRWRPPFITALRPEDRCHLNGLAVADGQPRYVTALAQTDTPAGWRGAMHQGGCLLEVPGGQPLARGLCLPHSPRVDGRRVFFLRSGEGDLALADRRDGVVTSVAAVPGVARGLALHGGYAFVGISKARPSLVGVPIVAKRDTLRCGIWVVDLRSGAIVAQLEFHTGVEEIFDVQVLPGMVAPYLSGPAADKDAGQPPGPSRRRAPDFGFWHDKCASDGSIRPGWPANVNYQLI